MHFFQQDRVNRVIRRGGAPSLWIAGPKIPPSELERPSPMPSPTESTVADVTSAPARPRWVGAGSSSASDSRAAGAEAAGLAVRGADVKLLVVFASQSHDLTALLAGIPEVRRDTPLI